MSGYQLRPKANLDLEAIGDFIAIDNPSRAQSFVREIRNLFNRIAENPAAFQRRDDLRAGLRQAVHGRYLVFFTADQNGVIVERILHGARKLDDLI